MRYCIIARVLCVKSFINVIYFAYTILKFRRKYDEYQFRIKLVSISKYRFSELNFPC